jgi:2-phospho-L-lactate guanylyltransferase
MSGVRLLVPVKSLAKAKTRLRAATGDGSAGPGDGDGGDDGAHGRLSLALARDTVAAARATPGVRDVTVITSDRRVAAVLSGDGAGVLLDGPERGLNAALRRGAAILRARDPTAPLGALQADLPALRPHELADALAHARSALDGHLAPRAFCPDTQGEGTTLLVCASGVELAPRFGAGSARAHERGGALRLRGVWPGLRRDVDTPDDLRRAAALGLGPATRDALHALDGADQLTAVPRR